MELASGGSGPELREFAIGRNFRDPLDIGVTRGSDGGGSTQFDLGA